MPRFVRRFATTIWRYHLRKWAKARSKNEAAMQQQFYKLLNNKIKLAVDIIQSSTPHFILFYSFLFDHTLVLFSIFVLIYILSYAFSLIVFFCVFVFQNYFFLLLLYYSQKEKITFHWFDFISFEIFFNKKQKYATINSIFSIIISLTHSLLFLSFSLSHSHLTTFHFRN